MTHSEIVVKCCKCRRVRVEGLWIRESSMAESLDRAYSHSFCPACLVKVHADLEIDSLPQVENDTALVQIAS